MKIKHPLHNSSPSAINVGKLTLTKGKPITIPLSEISEDLRAFEKAGDIRIVVRGKNAMLVKQ